MNAKLIEAARAALLAFEPVSAYGRIGSRDVEQAALQRCLADLRTALAAEQPAEPVAWAVRWGVLDMRLNSVHIERATAENVASRIKSRTEIFPLYAAPPAGPAPALPHPGSPEASAMMDSVLAEYEWPSNTKNAARAGYEAARRLAASPAAQVPLTDEQISDCAWGYFPDSKNLPEAMVEFARAIERAVRGAKP